MNEEWQAPKGVIEIKHPPQSEAWRKERENGIGGSDMPDLIGGDDYSCLRKLWFSKTGAPVDYADKGSWRLARGHAQEPIARTLFVEKTGRKVSHGHGTFAIKDRPHIRANVDGIIDDKMVIGRGLLEIKTLGVEKTYSGELGSFDRVKKNGVPEKYIAQGQWGAGILELSHISFGIFSPERHEILAIDMGFDPAYFGALTDRASSFWSTYITGDKKLVGPERLPDWIDGVQTACKYCPWRMTCKGINSSGKQTLAF